MASPEVTSPPGELMYIVMGLSGLSDSSHSNWATMDADTVSSMDPLRHIMRSWSGQSVGVVPMASTECTLTCSNLEKMSASGCDRGNN